MLFLSLYGDDVDITLGTHKYCHHETPASAVGSGRLLSCMPTDAGKNSGTSFM